jgi:hypothetical protein
MTAAHLSPLEQDLSRSGNLEIFPSLSGLFTSRSERRRSIASTTVNTDLAIEQFPKQGHNRRSSILRKLAGPRENAKRFLRLGAPSINCSSSPPPTNTTSATHQMRRSTRPRPVSEIIISPHDAQMLVSAAAARRMRSDSSSTLSMSLGPASAQDSSPVSDATASFPPLRHEKIVATGSGIAVGIALTEPVLFLQGYDQNDPSTKKSAMLRGQLHLKITKSVKIKKISICFRGQAQTDWPDGMFHS